MTTETDSQIEAKIKKNYPAEYNKCISKNCKSLSYIEVATGMMTFYCPEHDVQGNIVS